MGKFVSMERYQEVSRALARLVKAVEADKPIRRQDRTVERSARAAERRGRLAHALPRQEREVSELSDRHLAELGTLWGAHIKGREPGEIHLERYYSERRSMLEIHRTERRDMTRQHNRELGD